MRQFYQLSTYLSGHLRLYNSKKPCFHGVLRFREKTVAQKKFNYYIYTHAIDLRDWQWLVSAITIITSDLILLPTKQKFP